MAYHHCAVCTLPIMPEPRYFTDDGEPRHMLCDESSWHADGSPKTPAEIEADQANEPHEQRASVP